MSSKIDVVLYGCNIYVHVDGQMMWKERVVNLLML